MPNTPLLGITQVSASQANKEVTINDAIVALESATNKKLDADFASGTNLLLTSGEATRNFIYEATNASGAATLQIPNQVNGLALSRIFAVRNNSGHGLTVEFETGAGTSVAIPNGEARLLAAMNGTDIIVAAEPQTTVTFVSLTDTPSTLTGQSGRFLSVNLTEDALEFADAAVFPAYANNAGRYLVVNANEDGVEWVDLNLVTSFTSLTDSPASYSGQAGKLVAVNSGESGVEFIDAPEVEAVEFVSATRWRVRSVTEGPDPQVGFGEVEFLDGNGFTLIGSGTASASSFETGREAEQAFDGDLSAGTGWLIDPLETGPHWIEYAFTTAQTVRSARLYPITNFPDYSPLRFVFEYHDGSAWQAVGEYEISEWVDAQSQTFKIKGIPLQSVLEAPEDGQQYARQNGAWVTFEAGVGLSEAVEITAVDSNLLASQSTQYLRFTVNGVKTLTVRPEATEALPDNGEWHFQNEGTDTLTIIAATGVTINPPVGGSLVIPSGGTATLKRTAADTFNLFGVTETSDASAAEFTEAPEDGTPYARQDGGWVSTIEDAPSDGAAYVRQDGAWEAQSAVESLDDLSDVDVTTTSPANGQALVFDSGDDTWKPGSATSAGSTSPTVTESGTSANLLNSNSGAYQRWTATGAKTLTVRPNATESITQDAEFYIANRASSDNLTIVEGAGVTINPPAGGGLVLEPGMVVTLKRVAEDEFDLIGQTVVS